MKLPSLAATLLVSAFMSSPLHAKDLTEDYRKDFAIFHMSKDINDYINPPPKLPMNPPSGSTVVFDDKSGQGAAFNDYLTLVKTYKALGVHVKVEGTCSNDCTLLFFLPKGQVCVGYEAIVSVSGVSETGPPNGTNPTQQDNERMLRTFPRFVQRYVRFVSGGLTNAEYVLPPVYVWRFVPVCSEDEKRLMAPLTVLPTNQ